MAENLPWHKARIKFVAAFVLALVTVKTVNLVEIACAFAGRAKQDSQYKKLQRFFRFFEMPYADIATFVVKLLGVAGPWTLTLDRTNWKFGKAELNFLVLGIVHQGIAYPLVWWSLDKAGNSSTEERSAVMEILLELFGKEQIACLVADREFVGRQWLRWLRKQEINFHLRVHANYLVANGRGKMVHAYKLFRATRVNTPLVMREPRRRWGDEWYFSGGYLFNQTVRLKSIESSSNLIRASALITDYSSSSAAWRFPGSMNSLLRCRNCRASAGRSFIELQPRPVTRRPRLVSAFISRRRWPVFRRWRTGV